MLSKLIEGSTHFTDFKDYETLAVMSGLSNYAGGI